MAVSRQKQKALDELDHELSSRITRLRDTCAHMSRSLLARTDLQLASMPRSIREMSMVELISGHQSLSLPAATQPDIVSTKIAQGNKKRASNSPIRAVKKGRVEKSGVEAKKPATKRVKRG